MEKRPASESSETQRSLELLWGSKEKPSRGPKPTMTLEHIVQTAIEIASTEGVTELSMRRVAERLGSRPMSLYRYVQSKDEMIDLMLDALVGAPPMLEGMTGGWRAKLEYWARREWEVFQRYPWALQLVPRHLLMGPHRVGWLEAGLRALRGTGLSQGQKFDAVNVVDRYIRGTALELSARSNVDARWWPTHAPFLRADSGETKYAETIEVFETPPDEPPNDLEFGLQRILDGIAFLIEGRLSKKDRSRK